jgi:hypothetical protein
MSNPDKHQASLFAVIGAEMLIFCKGNQKGNKDLIFLRGSERK